MVFVVQITNAKGNGVLSKSADANVRTDLDKFFKNLTGDDTNQVFDLRATWYLGNRLRVRTHDLTGKIRIS